MTQDPRASEVAQTAAEMVGALEAELAEEQDLWDEIQEKIELLGG